MGKKTNSIKTRVEEEIKLRFEALARVRHLEVSDLAREAFREYLAKNEPATVQAGQAAGK